MATAKLELGVEAGRQAAGAVARGGRSATTRR